jgi:hypothetical protein
MGPSIFNEHPTRGHRRVRQEMVDSVAHHEIGKTQRGLHPIPGEKHSKMANFHLKKHKDILHFPFSKAMCDRSRQGPLVAVNR